MSTMLLALLFSLAPHEEPASRPVQTEPLRLGRGTHTYEWVSHWPKRPAGEELGSMHGGIVVDRRGRVLVSTDERGILVIDREGTIVASLCEELGAGVHSMTLWEESDRDLLLLAYLHNEIVAATLDGKIVWRLGTPTPSGLYPSDGETQVRYSPTGIALAPGGELYVADGYGTSYVHRFDFAREYVASFGGPGPELGKLQTPHGILFDTRSDVPQLVVADRENSRLQVFDLEGGPLAEYPADVRRPCALDLDAEGNMVVADLDGRVTILDPSFELVTHLGENPVAEQRANYGVPPEDWRDGVFLAPHSAAWDAEGNLYVAEWNRHGRIVKLARVRDGG